MFFCKWFVVFIVRCGFSTDILSVSMLFGVVVCKCVTSLTTLGGGGANRSRILESLIHEGGKLRKTEGKIVLFNLLFQSLRHQHIVLTL